MEFPVCLQSAGELSERRGETAADLDERGVKQRS
jgi:hypothetical protein